METPKKQLSDNQSDIKTIEGNFLTPFWIKRALQTNHVVSVSTHASDDLKLFVDGEFYNGK